MRWLPLQAKLEVNVAFCNKMWQVNDVNSLSTAYFQSSFVSSILLEWIMSVRLPASAVGCQTGTGKYQNTPCMAAWPSLTNSHTHLLLTSEEVRSQTKRCSSKHKHCFRTFQPRTQHIFFPRKSYVLFLDNETCNGALLLFFYPCNFQRKSYV